MGLEKSRVKYDLRKFSFYNAPRNARIASVVGLLAIQQFHLSVRLSHAGIVSKRHVARCSLQFALSDSKMCLVL